MEQRGETKILERLTEKLAERPTPQTRTWHWDEFTNKKKLCYSAMRPDDVTTRLKRRPSLMIAAKATTWESRGLTETTTFCRVVTPELRSLNPSRKTACLTPLRAKSSDVTPSVFIDAASANNPTEPSGSIPQLPCKTFSEGSVKELIMMYRRFLKKGDLPGAVQCVQQFIRADRADVLQRIIRKEFLKIASRQKAVKIAIEFVELLPKEYVDRRTYNMLAMVCVHARDPENAMLSAELMEKRGFKLDLPMYTNLITAFGMSGDVNKAFQIYAEMKNHGLVPDCMIAGALATVCAAKMKSPECTDRRGSLVLLERAMSLLQDLQNFNVPPDTTLCNVLVTCAGRTGQLQRGFDILQDMKENGCNADYVTYGSLIDASVRAERRDLAKRVYEMALRELPKPHISLYTVALESCMCGPEPVDSDRAFEIYRQAERSGQPTDVHFFSTMIRIAGKAGMPDLALSIEDNMRVQGIQQSTVTCSALISAALASHDLELASKIYTSMTSKKIFPDLYQFTNLMQAYSRAHRFGEIVRLVDDMMLCELQLDDVTADILLCSFKDAEMADLAFAVYTLLKGLGVPTTERICYTLLDICHIQIKALRGVKWEKPGWQSVAMTEGMALLKALSGNREVPQLQSVSASVWVDRAVSIYRSALSSGIIPSLRLLGRICVCLRIPGSSHCQENTQPDLNGLNPYSDALSYDLASEEVAAKQVSEECFDKRIIQVVKEAIQSELIPPFCIDDQRETKVGDLPASIAEAYVFTMMQALKFRYQDRGHYGHTIIFSVKQFDPKKALLPSNPLTGAAWRANATESGSVCEQEREGECIALGVVSILRRLRLWHSTNPKRGLIFVSPRDITNWMNAEQNQLEESSNREGKYMSPFSAKIAAQQQSFRTMNVPDILEDSYDL